MGVVSESHCCMATAKHIRGNKMVKQCYSRRSLTLMIGIFQGEMELIRRLSGGLMISMDVDSVVYG